MNSGTGGTVGTDLSQQQRQQRHSYESGGRVIYQWEQTLSEFNIYIEVPEGVRAKQLDISIERKNLSVGIAGNPPYLNKELGGFVKPAESFWTLDTRELHIQLCKAEDETVWEGAFVGHELNTLEREGERKQLILERFQAEHPGFDFSGAEISGSAPDPRTFLRD